LYTFTVLAAGILNLSLPVPAVYNCKPESRYTCTTNANLNNCALLRSLQPASTLSHEHLSITASKSCSPVTCK